MFYLEELKTTTIIFTKRLRYANPCWRQGLTVVNKPARAPPTWSYSLVVKVKKKFFF